jgi:transcriptional regulator with XRE-family HTH domain
MTIAELIRLYRQKRNMSQTELASKSGVNLKSLSRYELGTSIPPANTLKDLADAMGISTDALLGEEAVIKDKELFKKFEIIQQMDEETKKIITNFLDLTIRDFKAKQAYS